MNRLKRATFAGVALLAASSAHAITHDHGVVVFSQADALAGNITPGDTPGFPVTISVGGSYRLGSNLVVTTQANGIEVRANEVSIDMGGFTLAGSGAGRNGIASFNRNLRVEHGTVRGFTNDGVRSIAPFLTVTEMVVTANGRYGVYTRPEEVTPGTAAYAAIASSNVSGNGLHGIACGRFCRVENNIVSKNGGCGIDFIGSAGLALGNVVSENSDSGILFLATGGAGNNTAILNADPQIAGSYLPLQPNACDPACPPSAP